MGNAKLALERQQKSLVPSTEVQTAAGRVRVRWETDSASTPMGQLAYFIEFLTLTGLLSRWQKDCPLDYHSPNAPSISDVLGTWMLSIGLRRAIKAIPEQKGVAWLEAHMRDSVSPLLDAPWIMDIDTTVKPLYGKQEGSVVGYNPTKPGRPSHSYHTYLMAGMRLVLGVEVKCGNESSGSQSLPGLVKILDELAPEKRPKMVRGDCGFGSDNIMSELEIRMQP